MLFDLNNKMSRSVHLLAQIIRGHFAQRSFFNLLIALALVFGFVFFVFSWVPYKQAERQLSIVRRQATLGQSSLREFQNMMSTLAQSSRSWNRLDVAYRLYGPKGIINTMLQALQSDSLTTLPKNNLDQPRLQASIFYPWLNKKVRSDFQLHNSVTKDELNELTVTLTNQQIAGQALINLMVFDPAKHLDSLLAAKDERALATKLNSINEAVGQSELALTSIIANDKSVKKILEAVKFQHQQIISTLDLVAQGNYTEAQKTKNQMVVSLENFRKEFERLELPFLAQTKRHLTVIDQLAQDYEKLLKKITAFQEGYF